MKAPAPKNLAASVKARLLTVARRRGEEFQLTLTRFALERLFFRIGKSAHRDKFVLKGAMLFTLWGVEDYRATRDAACRRRDLERSCTASSARDFTQ